VLPQPTALVDKRVCLAFSWLPFAIEQRTLARRAPVCQRSCTSASTDALERRARSTASRKSRHCMKHGKPTCMTACRERPFTRCAGTQLYVWLPVELYRTLSVGNAARAMEKSLNYTRKPHTAVHVR